MPLEHRVNINPDVYFGRFQEALSGHMADLRNTLRTLEDGSFAKRANSPRPNAVIGIQLAPTGGHDTDRAKTAACTRCFLSLVRASTIYMDRMIAVQRCAREKTVGHRGLHGTEGNDSKPKGSCLSTLTRLSASEWIKLTNDLPPR